MDQSFKDYLRLYMPPIVNNAKPTAEEISCFLLLCKQAERNHSYQLAEYLCWMAKQNKTMGNVNIIITLGNVYIGVNYMMNNEVHQEYFEICKFDDLPKTWIKFLECEDPTDELSEDEIVKLLTTVPRYMWEREHLTGLFNYAGQNLEEDALETWESSTKDRYGFLIDWQRGIYYNGRKILTSTPKKEFRNGANGTWFLALS